MGNQHTQPTYTYEPVSLLDLKDDPFLIDHNEDPCMIEIDVSFAYGELTTHGMNKALLLLNKKFNVYTNERLQQGITKDYHGNVSNGLQDMLGTYWYIPSIMLTWSLCNMGSLDELVTWLIDTQRSDRTYGFTRRFPNIPNNDLLRGHAAKVRSIIVQYNQVLKEMLPLITDGSIKIEYDLVDDKGTQYKGTVDDAVLGVK